MSSVNDDIITELDTEIKKRLWSLMTEKEREMPFKFANRVIVNPEDTKPIMFAYLFKLKLKSRFKDDKRKGAFNEQ